MKKSLLTALISILACSSTFGQIVVPGADGSDGAFNPVANTTVNLANSPNGSWNGVNPDPATPLTGVYDFEKWAVVFRFTSVNIPSNVTVTFANHPANAPVVWLVSGTVTIAGTVNLSGANGHSNVGVPVLAESGPGGFRGGRGNQSATSPQSGGFGPGGTRNPANNTWAVGGSYGGPGLVSNAPASGLGPTYGHPNNIPLIGGSGGAGYHYPLGSAVANGGGGAGGGAILIGATQTITVTGTIRSNGGNAGSSSSGGSGGAIRLVADQVTGAGLVQTIGGASNGGGAGGDGRIRVENNVAGSITCVPPPSLELAGATAIIWPTAVAPLITITMVHNQGTPADPHANMDFPGQDVSLTNPNPFTVIINCSNVPINSTVKLRAVPKTGTDCLPGTGVDCLYSATFVSGDGNASVWHATVQLPDGFSSLQARVVLP